MKKELHRLQKALATAQEQKEQIREKAETRLHALIVNFKKEVAGDAEVRRDYENSIVYSNVLYSAEILYPSIRAGGNYFSLWAITSLDKES